MTSTSARSVAGLLLERVAATPAAEAFRFRNDGGWTGRFTWSEVLERVRSIASGLRALGLVPEDRVAIVSRTRVEWILADLGVLTARGASTTIYPSSTPDEGAFILRDSGSRIAFAEDEKQVAKLVARRDVLPELRQVIALSGPGSADGWVLSLDELLERGRAADARDRAAFEEGVHAIEPSELATIIYTSGTTGRPKGVELTHDNWIYEGEAVDRLGLFSSRDVQLLWLPLAHAFGKVLEVVQLRLGFLTAIDGRVDRLVENMPIVRPTFVAAVPRVFEKVHNHVMTTAASGGAIERRLLERALAVGTAVSRRRREGRPIPATMRLEHRLLDRAVLSRIRGRFGGKLRFFFSGGAPLAAEIAEFFHAIGVLVIEGYGLTETSAISFGNLPGRFRFGTVGAPVPGTEVRFTEDDEILIRGRGVMRRYHNLPDETRQTIDEEGWLHTGDVGRLGPDGLLEITDRKKDLIKTSGGKYVAPQALELHLKAICPYISQVVVHGDRRSYCTALLALDEAAVRGWAKGRGLGTLPLTELAAHPAVHRLIQEYVDALDASLASHEAIRRFIILPHELTEEAGELTASLKIKRKVVEAHYREVLDAMYAESDGRPPPEEPQPGAGV